MAQMAAAASAARCSASSASCTGGIAGAGWLLAGLLQHVRPAACSAQGAARWAHLVPAERPSVVPADILRELRDLDASLTAASHLDGRRRSGVHLTAAALPAPLPPHAIEPGLPLLPAHVRPHEGLGRLAAKWLRRLGRVPGRLYSLPGEAKLMLHLAEVDVAKMLRTYGRNGCTARVFQLDILAQPPNQPPTQPAPPEQPARAPPPQAQQLQQQQQQQQQQPALLLGSVRVKPVRVHLNAVTQRLEELDLIYCPPDRVVRVDVPVRLLNDDLAPGVRKGGWMAMDKRTVRYKALGASVPPYIEVNVRHLDLEQAVTVRELPVPPGTKLAEKDFNARVLRCTTDVGKD